MGWKEIKTAVEQNAEISFRRLGFTGPSLLQGVYEVVDKKTGVCYLYIYRGNGGVTLTPRLNRDGSLMIVDISKPNQND